MTGSPTVARVLAGQLCSGCGLCASLTGSPMIVEQPGYNRPAIKTPVAPDTEQIIAQSCPGAVVAPWKGELSSHPYWGPYREITTGHATDETLRHTASSGGVLSAALAYALDSGQVDWVLEIGPDPDRPTRNIVSRSTTAADVLAGAGSRYAPSSPLQAINAALAEPGRFAFVGKPCDVSALRLLGRFDPRVADKIPLMLSFFCAGIPSLAGSTRVLGALGIEPENVTGFRYRGNGWPGYATATLRDGSEARMSYADSWGGHLSKQVQFRCKICPDAVGGVADLVCADAWYGGEEGYPAFDEMPGRSLVITRTAAGSKLLAEAVTAGFVTIDAEPLQVEAIEAIQPSQARRKKLVKARVAALKILFQPRPVMRDLAVDQAARRASIKESLRDFLGTMRRIVLRRR